MYSQCTISIGCSKSTGCALNHLSKGSGNRSALQHEIHSIGCHDSLWTCTHWRAREFVKAVHSCSPLDHVHGAVPPCVHRFHQLQQLRHRTTFLVLPVLVVLHFLGSLRHSITVQVHHLPRLLLCAPSKVGLYVLLLELPELGIGRSGGPHSCDRGAGSAWISQNRSAMPRTCSHPLLAVCGLHLPCQRLAQFQGPGGVPRSHIHHLQTVADDVV